MEGRKYALIKVAAGDYLCPSNDGETLWRFHTYEDGRVAGLEVDYEVRTFWRAVYIPLAKVENQPVNDLPGPWDDVWIESDWFLPTRKAAIDRMVASLV